MSKAERRPPRLLGCRVDALVVAFKINVPAAMRDELGERQAIADEAGRAALGLRAGTVELKRSRMPESVAFRNGDLRGLYDPRAAAGWVLEVAVLAPFLMTHSILEAVTLTEQLAASIGTITESRLRRFDLCADFSGFYFRSDDARSRIVTTRAKTGIFIADPKDVDEPDDFELVHGVREYRDAPRRVTGITVAAGNPLMARVYLKTSELELAGREQKRELEHASWRRGGWDGSEDVVRVEFQHRGRFLDEIGLRDARAVSERADAVWQRDVRWFRIIDPGTATRRKRSALDPRWKVVTETVFAHHAEPIGRTRFRGDGAQPAQVRGVALSMLGARGRLTPASITDDGEAVSEVDLTAALTPEEQEARVLSYYEQLGREAGEAIASDELTRYGARGALLRALAQNDGTIARFSTNGEYMPGLRAGRAPHGSIRKSSDVG